MTNLSPEVERIFHEIADLDPGQRAEYFEKYDVAEDVRREVEELLAADVSTDHSLAELVGDQIGATLNRGKETEVGDQCGPYRLLKEIGRGGMGEVWLAERIDGLMKRQVALKLPYLGIQASEFVRRSHRERDILASLAHQGIARLYDAGLTEAGTPFLVLEFIEGVAIDRFCDEHQLPVRDRLSLFIQVLDAVQYAHSHLIIHSDLKPSNILVSSEGEAKLLDFGIAKLIRSDNPAADLILPSAAPLTPGYAAPEQIAGQRTTTACDVFSLGVILFELLSGQRPFAVKRNLAGVLEQQTVTERPSQAALDEAKARARSSTPKRLSAALKGDLDNITLKAIQQDPEKRYTTVDAFKSDLQRYLSGEPVLARPESTWYRAKKFIGRHKVGVAAVASVMSQVQAESEIRMKNFLNLPFAQAIRGVLLDQVGCEPLFLADFEAGKIIADRFRIVRFLAKGGMGVVYEAFDEKLHRRVAIKFAKPGFGKRLPPEVRHASEITHPNVCRIFDIHTSNGPSGELEFLTMELLDGCTLADRLANGGFDGSSAVSTALQLCEGLAEAHRHGVIHGDLKCNNVILVPAAGGIRERAVITDFGLARRPNLPDEPADLPRMASGPIGGARAYMAPELQQGQKQAMTSDVYAMGVILRELSLASHSDLPRRWNRTIKRCLESAPGRRFSNGEALLRALRPSSKHRWIVAAAAALFAASLSGMLTYERASAPKRTVRLALLPFEDEGAESYRGIKLSRAAAARFAQLKGSTQVRFEFLDRKDFTSKTTIDRVQAISAATHVIHGAIERAGPGNPQGSEVVHAFLTDTRTGVDKAEWRLPYCSDVIQFAPVALAGLAAIWLDLPPLLSKSDLNATASRYYTAGMQMIRAEVQPDEAVLLFKRAVAAGPDSALAYAGLAEAQLFQSRTRQDNNWLEQARESVRQAELRNPDLAEVHLISGWIDKTSGHYELATKHFLRAIESQAGSATAWRRLGQTYEAAGQEGEALDALKRAVHLEPNYFKNHRELGIFFYRRNRFIEAVKEFSAMALLVPNSPDSHTLLGESWYQMSKYGNAESELKIAAKLQDTSDTEQTLGAVFWDQDKDEEAANHYLRALQIGPENSSIWMSLSFCYREQGLVSRASNAYRQGLNASGRELAQDPRNARAHASQAYFEAMLHDPARAEIDAAEALNLSHDDDTTQFAVMTYEAIGRRDLALRALETSPEVLSELRRYPWLAPLRFDAKKGAILQ